MFIHIDCNAYFASCEIAANRTLEGKPVVVANDNAAGGGIILALNAQAKAFGLRRGMPLFQVRSLISLNHVNVCQVRHRLYHDISGRIMRRVQQQGLVVDFVQYSVDEFFGTMPLDDPDELRHYVGMVKAMIWEEEHIPVSCGCGQTYTLAKVATHFAKTYKGYKGICVLTDEKRQEALRLLPVGEVWGIGRKLGKRLEAAGVRTAHDLATLADEQAAQLLNTTGLRTLKELRGTPCMALERPAMQSSIMQSSTFAFMVERQEELESAAKGFAQTCCATLRKQGGLCGTATLFLATNRHRPDLPQYANEATHKFRTPTSDTATVLKATVELLKSIYRPSYQYKRMGVVLAGIVPVEGSQMDLFNVPNNERRQRLMQVTDAINSKFGEGTIAFSSTKEDHRDRNAPLTYPNDPYK